MPTEARGSYLPKAAYLRETKTCLNYMPASESTLDSGTSGTASHSSRHDMLAIISSRYQYGPFLFLLQKLCQITWLLTGWKFFSTSGGPLRPEARGICHICHMVNPALVESRYIELQGTAVISSIYIVRYAALTAVDQLSGTSIDGTDRQTDGRTPDRYTDPAQHILHAASIIDNDVVHKSSTNNRSSRRYIKYRFVVTSVWRIVQRCSESTRITHDLTPGEQLINDVAVFDSTRFVRQTFAIR